MRFEKKLEKIKNHMANSAMTIALSLDFQTRPMTDDIPHLNMRGYKTIRTQSVSEVVDCLNTFNNVNAGNVKALDRLRFVHMGHRRTLSETFRPTPTKRNNIYQHLQSLESVNPGHSKMRRGLFPCIIPLAPNYHEKEADSYKPRHLFAMASDPSVIQEFYRFGEKIPSEDFLQKTGWAIAWPYTNKEHPEALMWYIHDENNMTERPLDMDSKKQMQHASFAAAKRDSTAPRQYQLFHF